MKLKIKWAIALISVGILFTMGGAVMKILNISGSNRLLIYGLIAHLSGFSIAISDLLYAKKIH